MTGQVKALVGMTVAASIVCLRWTAGHPAQQWPHFFVFLVAILLSSGMKIALPKSDGTMSVNFPFILLGILLLSPLQAVSLAVCSVIAQCRIRIVKAFTLIQIVFNVANVVTATVLAWHCYAALVHVRFETAPAIAVAATVYFFVNTIPVALVIAAEVQTSPLHQWRRDYLWYLPFYLVGAMLAAGAYLVGTTIGWMSSLLIIPLVYTIYRAYNAQMAMMRDRERHAEETEALHLRTIEALAMAIEAKDRSTHQHLLRVRVYVSELASLMKLDKSTVQALLTASFLHDIGKLAVPEHIINKPGKLSPEEFEKMKIHPVVGADILERVRFPYPVVPIVRSHHEAWNGSGYPDGLQGEEIPIGARILTVVDCFDALASERPYRRALPLKEAMAHIRSLAGIQFDPQIVDLLEAHYLELEGKARDQIEAVPPLETDLIIHRGAAPGAGFEVEHTAHVSAASSAPHAMDGTIQESRGASLQHTAAVSQEAQAVSELDQFLEGSLSARETSSLMFRRLQSFVPNDCATVFLKEDNWLVPRFVDGECAPSFSTQRFPLESGLSGWVAQSARPIVNGNPTVEPHYLPQSGTMKATSSALAIPLFDLTGAVLGVLTLYSKRSGAFSKNHLRILQAIESKLSLSMQKAMSSVAEESDLLIDPLTQLPNMRFFLEQLDREVAKSKEAGGHFAAAVCDLNAFREVNKEKGHLLGNRMLKEIAEAFQACCRPEDLVARMGGDEFIFLFPSMDVPSAHRHLGMVEEAVHGACVRMGLETCLSTSVGIAFYPEDGQRAEELLGVADRRMYLQKQSFNELSQSHSRPKFPEGALSR